MSVPVSLLTEAVVARQCDELVAKLGGDIVRLEQRRASHVHLGLPDRRYRLAINGRHALWYELKSPKGQLSRAQYAFLTAERQCGVLASCGTRDELLRITRALAEAGVAAAACVCDAQIAAWAAKGFRGERKPIQTCGKQR
jgi:hypothetical protein